MNPQEFANERLEKIRHRQRVESLAFRLKTSHVIQFEMSAMFMKKTDCNVA